MTYVALGLVLLFGAFSIVGVQAINRSADLVFRQRLDLAQALAGGLDSHLRFLASDLASAVEGAPAGAGAAEIGARFRRLATLHPSPVVGNTGVLLLDRTGSVVDADPLNAGVGFAGIDRSIVDRVVSLGAPAVVTLAAPQPQTGAFGALLVPWTSGASTAAVGVVLSGTVSAAAFDPETGGAAAAGAPANVREAHYSMELTDPAGHTLAAIGRAGQRAAPSTGFLVSRHAGHIQDLRLDRRAAVGLHDAGTAQDGGDHVMAIAPLSFGGLVFVLEQSRDRALELPDQLQRQLIVVGLIGFGATLAVAWFTTRRVVKPTEALAQAAQRIAAGDLDRPVDVRAQDEIGSLARDFESMRVRLKAALDDVSQANERLEHRVATRTAHLREVLGKVISAQEDERLRIARELHDETAQSLTALTMALDRVRRPEDLPKIRQARELAQHTLGGTRRLLRALRPPALDDLGLLPAIRGYAEEQLEGQAVQVTMSGAHEADRLPHELELGLFRIAQEALTNVARYAQASNVRIALATDATGVHLSVVDDGVGFDLAAVAADGTQGTGLGLRGMRERAQLAGGELDIKSSRGTGTAVHVRIPADVIQEARG